ncbi:hypothetical protein C8F04DRAFT_1232721 [Mycena alexandri]|uniref:FAD-binding PCMH-type domain-containing protein n=1 Tax=Mycena alexandri TaxID=1745969 RepID=A0AAD6T1Y6_9AGAR|nr:hypothetical protein C8F04DRAFT_1232721 [Mycena alexandri]
MATIAGLTGNQYLPGTTEYVTNKYQYATSTHIVDHDMNPGLIVEPRGKDDIKKVIAFAKANKKAIAIRTGGHQYSGASSTGPENIQLSLSHTFKTPDNCVYFEKGDKSFVRTSCTHVHLGGHVQTGGYGQLGRSFGLFGDHVFSLEIIDHDGQEKEITRSSDPDLFFAWLGGSPGNLGVLTHFSIEVYRDADYRGARGLRAVHGYSTDKMRELLVQLAEMSDDENFPRNYDLCISVLSADFDIPGLIHGLDEQMREEHPEIFGVDPLKKKGFLAAHDRRVCAPDMEWFERLKAGAYAPCDVEEKPISKLTAQWIFRNTREFDHPYDGWVDWAVRRMDEVVGSDGNGQWLSAQLQSFGGKHSMFMKNAGNGTSYSWRDSTMCMVVDNFHLPEKKEAAEAWEATNDEEGIGAQGIFSKEDRRALWGSFGSFDLDSVWNTYHENRPKYERLMEARKRADPDGVFTPNTFCVKRAACGSVRGTTCETPSNGRAAVAGFKAQSFEHEKTYKMGCAGKE